MSPDSGSLAPPPMVWSPKLTLSGTRDTGPYIHPSIHPSIHTYIPTYLHTYVPTYLRTYVPTYLRTHVHRLHTYIHTNIPPPQATGGGPEEPYHHPRPRGGGTMGGGGLGVLGHIYIYCIYNYIYIYVHVYRSFWREPFRQMVTMGWIKTYSVILIGG